MRDLPNPPRIDALIRWAAAEFCFSSTPMIDARVLAKEAFALDESGLIAEGARFAEQDELGAFVAMAARRANQEPVAHIIGRREFWSLEIEMAPGILTPRADSEALISAVAELRPKTEALKILDLGCGSGALLCALLTEFPNATGLGVDINPEAIRLTERNLERLGLGSRAHGELGDWLSAVAGQFDAIIANPPYIRTIDRENLPREVRDFENPLALFAGKDGLDAYRAILAAAPNTAAPDGVIALELGEDQADAVNKIAMTAFPNRRTRVKFDLSGRPRVLVIDLRGGAN